MRAIYAGSFDPFTNGHLDIVREASKMFEVVYVLICHNPYKLRQTSKQQMEVAIDDTLEREGISNVIVMTCDKLVADVAKDFKVDYLIRGVRNNIDYNYEENIATVNEFINPNIRHIYFRASDSAISSSMVKELHSYGKDISSYVPREVLKVIN